MVCSLPSPPMYVCWERVQQTPRETVQVQSSWDNVCMGGWWRRQFKVPVKKSTREGDLWFCRDPSFASTSVLEPKRCACPPACLHVNVAYITCLNAHVAWNNQVKTAQAGGWAACCCALLPTICLCQKYLLCTEWGMKSIQVLFSQLLRLEGGKKIVTDACQISPHCQM